MDELSPRALSELISQKWLEHLHDRFNKPWTLGIVRDIGHQIKGWSCTHSSAIVTLKDRSFATCRMTDQKLSRMADEQQPPVESRLFDNGLSGAYAPSSGSKISGEPPAESPFCCTYSAFRAARIIISHHYSIINVRTPPYLNTGHSSPSNKHAAASLDR